MQPVAGRKRAFFAASTAGCRCDIALIIIPCYRRPLLRAPIASHTHFCCTDAQYPPSTAAHAPPPPCITHTHFCRTALASGSTLASLMSTTRSRVGSALAPAPATANTLMPRRLQPAISAAWRGRPGMHGSGENALGWCPHPPLCLEGPVGMAAETALPHCISLEGQECR